MKPANPNTATALQGYRPSTTVLLGLLVCLLGSLSTSAQTPARWKAHDMNRPRPPVVTSSPQLLTPAPSDAVVLFDGSDLSKWRNLAGGPAGWVVKDGYMESVTGAGYVYTRDSFGDVQLHVEWAAPVPAMGQGQGRGNSGVFLMSLYEVQVLDSFDNYTYADGQTAAVYGQYPPLRNAARPPGEWQSYDIFFRRPRFRPDGSVWKPARVTVLHNGILVQDNVEFWGPTSWLKHLPYESHQARLPLALQDHGNPVRYRNIWLRELQEESRPGPSSQEPEPVITLAPEVLDLYTGKYDDASGRGFAISREGSRLYAHIYELPKLELLTHSKQEFSLRWTAGRLVFDLDSGGKPSGLAFYIGRSEILAEKTE